MSNERRTALALRLQRAYLKEALREASELPPGSNPSEFLERTEYVRRARASLDAAIAAHDAAMLRTSFASA